MILPFGPLSETSPEIPPISPIAPGAPSLSDLADSNLNTTIIGNKGYTFNITLFNEQTIMDNNGNITRNLTEGVPLSKNALILLVIEDNIFNPFSEATLILNGIEVFEKSNDIKFSFRGNGRDIVFIEFMSKLENDAKIDNSTAVKQELMLSHAFVVTECRDINYDKRKAKKLKLVEAFQYYLNEKQCEYNTADDTKTTSADTNRDRSLPTGNIIKSLLMKCLDRNSSFKIEDLIDNSNFDIGVNQMCLSFSGDVNYSDAINYIKMCHTSNEPYSDSCILNYGRYTKTFKLESIGKIFAEHANETRGIETLIFNDTLNQPSKGSNVVRYPVYNAIFTESKIIKFNIDNPSGNSDLDFLANIANISVGKPVNTHIIDLKTGNIKEIIKKFIKLYVDPFKQMYGNIRLEPNFDLNADKLNKQSAVNKNQQNNEPKDVSKAKIDYTQIGALLFLQNTYSIELEGLTSRQSGKFVDIINNGTLDIGGLSRWDKYHMGRHFITSVKHYVTQDRYTNIIETIKPYRIQEI